MVQERFDSDSFSDVFAGGAPPRWLGDLIREARGRKLLYELSSTHKNCLLLNFAMQSILKNVGGGQGMVCAVQTTGPHVVQ